MNILLWGTQSSFTQQILTWLSQSHRLKAVIVPASPTQKHATARLGFSSIEALMPNNGNGSTTHLAWQQGLPVYGVRTVRHHDVATLVRSFAPDLVCVACFPWRIPPSLLTIPTFGFVNLHPSLLPAYRGPAPLFWQLRDGLRVSGVTAHWMDAEFDTGDIVGQQMLCLPEGASGPTIDIAYAELGATLIHSLLTDLAAGIIPRQPQPSGGTQHPWPQTADFTLDPMWSAQHAFNFMRGTAEWQQSYRVLHGDRPTAVNVALSYDATRLLPQPVLRQDDQIAIQFTPGVLYATSDQMAGQRFALELTV